MAGYLFEPLQLVCITRYTMPSFSLNTINLCVIAVPLVESTQLIFNWRLFSRPQNHDES